MDKKLKAKWVSALKSDRYKQYTFGALCFNGAYCCLGVLREINNKNDTSSHAQFDDGAMLTKKHLQKFGFDLECAWALADMNDAGVPFPVIAGFIQENL